jgi:hypothetical protein
MPSRSPAATISADMVAKKFAPEGFTVSTGREERFEARAPVARSWSDRSACEEEK